MMDVDDDDEDGMLRAASLAKHTKTRSDHRRNVQL